MRRKHTILKSSAQVKGNGVTPSKMGFNGDGSEKPDKNDEIPERWIASIRSSITRFESDFSKKQELRKKIIEENQFQDWNLISKISANLFSIELYKSASDTTVNDIKSALNLGSFHFLKKDYANQSILLSLDYDDSVVFIGKMEQICSGDLILEGKDKVLKLIKGFRLLMPKDVWLGLENEALETLTDYWIEIDPSLFSKRTDSGTSNAQVRKLTEDIATKNALKIAEYEDSADGKILMRISGDNKHLLNFLTIFELPNAYFSEALHTITYDSSGASDLSKVLSSPEVTDYEENDYRLPKVVLLDSNLPVDEQLNPILRNQIDASVYAKDGIEEIANRDHGVQMASIICFGTQLLNADTDNFAKKELISYAKIVPVFLGSKEPIINLHDIPKMLEQVSQDLGKEGQKIKICNASFNLKRFRKDCEGLSRFTYMTDEFLFFSPDVIFMASCGNILPDKIFPNHHTFEEANVYLPGDGINSISVGSSSNDEKASLLSRKNSFDIGRIKNDIRHLSRRDTHNVKRFRTSLLKPDLLARGELWTPASQENVTRLLHSNKEGTSHATAFVSHISARCQGEYPDLETGLGIESVLLHSTSKPDRYFSIDPSKNYSETIQQRLTDLGGTAGWLTKESEWLEDRLVGNGIISEESALFNNKNQKTYIIEGLIGIGQFLQEKLDLSEFLTKEILESHELKFSGIICFRGIPYLADSIGCNLVNVRAKIGNYDEEERSQTLFNSTPADQRENDSKYECKKAWSSSLMCDYQWGNRQRFDRTTRSNIVKESLLKNHFCLDLLIQSACWRNREEDIKKFVKNGLLKFFPQKEQCPTIWRNLWGNEITDLAEVKIPYAICVTASASESVSLYGETEAEIETAQLELGL